MTQLLTYKLFFNPEDYRLLKGDIWSDDPVPARLNARKRRFNVDVAYRGSHIRDAKKKSYDIYFAKKPDSGTSDIIHLNAEYKDPSLLRNKLSLDFFSSLGLLSPSSRYVNLVINGMRQGVYLHIETVDKVFLKKRGLPDGGIYYAIDDDANFSLYSSLDEAVKKDLISGYEQKLGDKKEDEHLKELVYRINTLPRASFTKEISSYVDVKKYLKWLAGIICTQNFDGFVHNYALYRNSATGLFEMIPWDYDATWGRDIHGEVMEEDYISLKGFNTLTARLLADKSVKDDYKSYLLQLMDNQFSPDYLTPIIYKSYNKIRPSIEKDPFMKSKLKTFDQEPDFIINYIKKRRSYIKEHVGDL